MSSPLITLEITVNTEQAPDLTNALTTGANEVGCSVGIQLRDMLDESVAVIESTPGCSGTTRKAWLAPRGE